jgi:hypothetical protein
MERRGIEPTNGTLAALSVGCSKTLQLDLAEDFLERISDTQLNYRHACNTLLAGCKIMVMHKPFYGFFYLEFLPLRLPTLSQNIFSVSLILDTLFQVFKYICHCI